MAASASANRSNSPAHRLTAPSGTVGALPPTDARPTSGIFRIEHADHALGLRASDPPLEHFGLSSMRERVEMVGGSFQVRSTPGEGTTVTAVLAIR